MFNRYRDVKAQDIAKEGLINVIDRAFSNLMIGGVCFDNCEKFVIYPRQITAFQVEMPTAHHQQRLDFIGRAHLLR